LANACQSRPKDGLASGATEGGGKDEDVSGGDEVFGGGGKEAGADGGGGDDDNGGDGDDDGGDGDDGGVPVSETMGDADGGNKISRPDMTLFSRSILCGEKKKQRPRRDCAEKFSMMHDRARVRHGVPSHDQTARCLKSFSAGHRPKLATEDVSAWTARSAPRRAVGSSEEKFLSSATWLGPEVLVRETPSVRARADDL
jgi:hypothetical protein